MINSFLKPFYHDLKTLILDTLFPIYCLVCEQESQQFICNNCKIQLTRLPHQVCIVCHKMSIGGLTHPKCLSPHTADGLISIFDYSDEKIANILIKGKYSFIPTIYKELGLIISDILKADFPCFLQPTAYNLKPTITPIPLHKWRQRWRGFNQSKVLAETLAEQFNLPTADVLLRKKFTKTQKDLKKEARIKNIASAFVLSPLSSKAYPELAEREGVRGSFSPLFSKEGVRGSSFILIDDVTTTGSTLLEATKVLKRNGAEKVFCLTVAKD